MSRGTTRTRDEDERLLWETSRRYMQGEIGIEALEEIERPHVQNLKEALVTHAKRRGGRTEFTRRSSPGERERYLWMASRLYMSGEIGVEKLEEIEAPHMHELRRAIISLAKRQLIRHLFRHLRVNRDQVIHILLALI